ncbi:MAG: SDR family oxidoreductase [Candidatus Eremiobacteraeota bacterium]|nr:SDR family oxidoreductase [Candidatus Eremiobacteraeota bacterium]
MGKVAVVTGASAGVGRAIVREYAKQGYDVGLIARGPDGLEAAKREVEQAGRRAVAVPVDVADAGAVEAAADRIERELGEITVWTNVAFSNVFAEFSALTAAEYRRITEVSYLGFVHGTMSALKRMQPRDRGTIIQIGSALAYRSIPLQAAYCGAKSAIRGFTDSIRCELHHHGSNVRITMAVLPAVNTPQFTWCRSKLARKAQPVPPIYQPEVIARAVVWLAAHPRRELRIGWATVKALAGQILVPGLLDRYLGKTGYEGQQYDGGWPADHPDNLDRPLPGDWGAHGDFDDRATDASSQLWLTTHHGAWLGIAAACAVAAFALAPGRGASR